MNISAMFLRRVVRIACVVMLLPLASLAGPLTEVEFNRRADWLRADVLHRISGMTLPGNPEADSSRNLVHAAYYLLTFGVDPDHDVATAEGFLRRAFAAQTMDPSSPKYGDIPWTISKPNEVDANAIEFAMSPLGPILARHAGRLSPAMREEAIAHARAAIPAIQRHRVRVVYSNIYLMRAENLLLLGEALNDPAVAAEGASYFDNWLRYTRTNGVTEYDSPVYTAVQIDCLNFAYTYATNPTVKAKLRVALDYLWTDLAANTLRSRGMISGAHGRCYEFVDGTGCVDRQLYLSGLRDAVPRKTLINDCGRDIGIVTDGGYRPSAELLAIADLPERVIRQRWGEEPGKDKYNFVTPDFAIGSSGLYGGLQDRQLAVDFAGPDTRATVSLTVDGWDSPYGTHKFKGNDGHSKARKLKNASATVQDRGTVLSLLELTPDLTKFDVNSLSTNLVFPSDADRVLVDGKVVATDKCFTLELTNASVVAFRVGRSMVAMRIFAADGCAGQTPVLQLKLDEDGIKSKAARLVAYAYRSPERTERKIEARPTRAGLVVSAASCANDDELTAFASRLAEADFTQTYDGGVWHVTSMLDGKRFEAALDCETRASVIRRVDGRDIVTDRLTVNDRDVAAEMLDPLTLPPATPTTMPELP